MINVQQWIRQAVRLALVGGFAISLAPAQIPGVPKPSKPAAPQAESSEQAQEKLKTWLKESRAAMAKLEEPDAESQLPQGVTPAELAERRRDLDQTIRTLNRLLAQSENVAESETALAEARKRNEAWSGFEEAPPYSILMLDDLVSQREAATQKSATSRSSQTLFNRTLDGMQKESAVNQAALSLASDAAARAADDAAAAARWRAESLQIKQRLLAVRVSNVQQMSAVLKNQENQAEVEIDLLNRQIEAAEKDYAFTDDDLAKVRKSAEERQKALAQELADVRKRLGEAVTQRRAAKAEVDGMAADETGNVSAEALAQASSRLTAAEARADTLQFIAESIEGFQTVEAYLPGAYENRRILLQSQVAADREKALADLRQQRDRLNAWDVVATNELEAVNAELSRQDSLTSLIAQDDSRLPSLVAKREVLWEKVAFLQRISQTVKGYAKTFDRWIKQAETNGAAKSITAEVNDAVSQTWSWVRNAWNHPVFETQVVRNIGGVNVPGTRSVSVGLIVCAVTFFIVAYAVAAKVSRRLQRVVVTRGRIAEAQANTLRTWLMILVGFFLVLTTLHFMEIPLTVFAFFGGALAIGLGFGTQTLIKNFISGIIVLFERRIRVGDIINVGAVTGSVVEINTRSSIVRSGDGTETMIPNSLFLEKEVANLTLSNRRIRKVVRVGVAYGVQLTQVSAALKECVERHGLVLKDPAPLVIFEDFGDSALMFAVYYWIEFNDKTNGDVVASDLRFMIEKRLTELGIGIPFPQRDLNVNATAPIRVEVVQPAPPVSE